MNKPYVFCHMMTTLDGRIECGMLEYLNGGDEYYKVLNELPLHSAISGRVTAEIEMSSGKFKPKNISIYKGEKIKVNKKVSKYDIIFDTLGSLRWDNYKNPLIIVTGCEVTADYINYLNENNISYIINNSKEINLAYTLEVLKETFKINNIAIVGGGNINGAFLKNGLIDEITVILAPGIDGRESQTALFDGIIKDNNPYKLKLKDIKKYDNDAIYLDYLVIK